MSSILETIQTLWATKKGLTDLVPATQVFLGPPNPGSQQPCVGLVSERIDQLVRTSTGCYVQVEVELVAQADNLDLLESLQEAIRQHLDGWTSTRYQALQQRSLSMNMRRAAEGQPPVRLSPFSLGWLVNWRNEGYFCDRAIAGARERGIAPAEYVPEYILTPRRFKDGWEEEAKKYRPLEWWDVDTSQSQKDVIRQCLTILATGRPLYIAYNWWGHALECVGMRWDGSKVIWQVWNSHGDGVIELTGSRGVPDEAYGVRATSWGPGGAGEPG